ncbi:MAG TPA: acyltransferase [Candidatus Acidoferrum sp.]|jgi:peptidoglycan/LPS O-acetylase OafA/YrhL
MPSPAATKLLPSLQRIDGVDLLRGLAIFFVLMNHVNIRLLIAKIPYAAGLPRQFVGAFVWNGQSGVQIFFAISGFLITSTALRRWGKLSQVSLRGFYLTRFARIVPLLVLLLVILSGLHFAGLRDFVVSSKTGGLPRAIFAAVTFHINVLEARRGYLPGNWDILWSLSVEEVFYLFFPIVSRLFSRGKFLVILLASLVMLGPFARTLLVHGNEIWREYSYLGGMDAIALGCLTALAASRLEFSSRNLRLLAVIGSALLIFILCFPARPANRALENAGLDMTILAIATCMLITASFRSGWKAPCILFPLLRLGQRSYEVYLTHMFVVFAFFHFFLFAGNSLRTVPLLFIAVIFWSTLLGEFVARVYSEPLNRAIRSRFAAARPDASLIRKARFERA